MNFDFFVSALFLFLVAGYLVCSWLVTMMYAYRDTGYSLYEDLGFWGAAWAMVKAEAGAFVTVVAIWAMYAFLNAILFLQIGFIEATLVWYVLSIAHGVARGILWERALPGPVMQG